MENYGNRVKINWLCFTCNIEILKIYELGSKLIANKQCSWMIYAKYNFWKKMKANIIRADRTHNLNLINFIYKIC